MISKYMSAESLETLIAQEIDWAENKCKLNLTQRKRYRAIWMFFRDLVRASWVASFNNGILEMQLPSLNKEELENGSSPKVKALLRSWMQESRVERLVAYKDFIYRMERPSGAKGAISSLIADGKELAARLAEIEHGNASVFSAVKPYLQLVEENARDVFTGQKLSEIWRYFRLTWSTPSETTPGRTMQYLIRDAAHPNHAVMGIASLENCAVQITCRDNYIGWNPIEFITQLKAKENIELRHSLSKLLGYLEDGIKGIRYEDLCSDLDIANPTDTVINELFQKAEYAENLRQSLLKDDSSAEQVRARSELGSIDIDTEHALYLRKRSEQLARLLSAKMELLLLLNSEHFDDVVLTFINSEKGYSAIRTALIAQKGRHIGSSMMELNVCGAIPPYNEILGGKLVALLALSPQVINDYQGRYANRESEIASRLKGAPVCRPADLVYIGTTSLYYVGSSQYNRLRLPADILGGPYGITWKKLGLTVGFGTMHISKSTTLSLTETTNDIGFARINHVFGEGASPKMRLLTMSIRELLETSQEDTRDFSKHAMSRIVYGAELAENTKEYLLGDDDAPKYYFSKSSATQKTQEIIDYWSSRWLLSRLKFPPLLDRIKSFSPESLLVSKEIDKESKWEFRHLEEVPQVNSEQFEQLGLDFVRLLYRGRSAFADMIDFDLLQHIHVKTSVDEAILKNLSEGRDVILTGNPGDGKTHLVRVLRDDFSRLPIPPHVELDASCLSNEEILESWNIAIKNGRPFVLAINAAVLASLAEQYPDNNRIVSAFKQLIGAMKYSDTVTEHNEKIVVYDLSKREVLSADIIARAISKITDEQHYATCAECQLKNNCEAVTNKRLLNEPLFQERLNIVLSRVALNGYHATLRELLSFLSYLIFGDRSCEALAGTAGDNKYSLVNLIHQGGMGRLFEEIQKTFDPAMVSHPIFDELLLENKLEPSTWANATFVEYEAISTTNIETFKLRKRQFFYFNAKGNAILDISDDNISKYQRFLEQDDKKSIREILRKLNSFFGIERAVSELEIWSGHRYNNLPRRVLLSVDKMGIQQFSVVHPSLINTMQDGIAYTADHVRLQKKDRPDIFLKIDYALFCLFLEAERGVPIMFMENDVSKKVWRFIEQLQNTSDMKNKDDVTVTILDVYAKKELRVSIDKENRRYSSIEKGRELK